MVFKGFINKKYYPKWLSESNRNLHFEYAIPTGFLFTILFTFGLAIGMEFKDKLKGGSFDKLDLLATILGGIIGQILQIFFVYFLYRIFF